MKTMETDWYRHIWGLDIKKQSWVENTKTEVDFIIKTLCLSGRERILDLACGFGRHSLAFAELGYNVTGVDLTEDFVRDAKESARRLSLPNARFLQADLRELSFRDEFDVVLNLADGAIGYLETDEENLKIFDVIAGALRPGGKHFMDVNNAEHAARYFPKRHWEAGERELSLAEFDWNPATRRMLFCGWQLPYGQPLQRPVEGMGNPIRLYDLHELEEILNRRGMRILDTFSDYAGKPAGEQEIQLMIYSRKAD